MSTKDHSSGTKESQIIGFRLSRQLAADVKTEAVQRNIPLNKLFVEMWEIYKKERKKNNGSQPR